MYAYEDIRVVHLEVTSRCNARCPMCLRNLRGGKTLPNLPLVELSRKDAETIFKPEFVSRLERLYMCGNYGDAVAAKDTAAIFEYLRAHNPKLGLRLHTNASGRPAAWWKRLAAANVSVVFGVDGLEDTNHLHRRGTEWNKIIKAAKAFISAGGWAEWDFLVFRHNEHQVDEARALAESMGFKKFTVKKSNRFLGKDGLIKSLPVHDARGRLEYKIEIPRRPEHRNQAVVQLAGSSSPDEYLLTTPVSCKVAKEKSLYITAEGLAFPCCWTGKLYDSYHPEGLGEGWKLVDQLPGGKSALSAKKRPLKEIVEGEFFRKLVPATWKAGSEARGCATTCARVCGTVDLMAGQK